MEESAFVSIFEQVASEVIGNTAIVKKHANLFYELYLNRELMLAVPDTSLDFSQIG